MNYSKQTVAFFVWAGSGIVGLFAGFAVLGFTYAEHMDCSNPGIHESANTPLGWSVALLATVIPLVIGMASCREFKLLRWLPLTVALFEAVFWLWVLNPSGCEWSALASTI